MRKWVLSLLVLSVVACAMPYQDEEIIFDPDINRIARNTVIVEKSSQMVVYEYKNIRIDELSAVAALYCQDHGQKQAVLHDIQLTRGNARRAVFFCRETSRN